jgi:hypothetical protein
MPYYIRLFARFARHVPIESIVASLASRGLPRIHFHVEEGSSNEWTSVLFKNDRGDKICIVERNESGVDGLFDEEVAEFVEILGNCLPRSGADWVASYLTRAEVVYACQFLEAGSSAGEDEVAPHNILWAIKDKAGGIIQADNEGFSNEDGYSVTWQFDDTVSGPWNCAVLTKKDQWTAFEMDLGNRTQRAEFMDGKVPRGTQKISTG